MRGRLLLLVSLLAQHLGAQPSPAPARSASLGECQTAGGVIRDCRIRYRTLGRLDATRGNAVFVPTWFAGESGEWIEWLRLPEMIDTTRYFVVIADALGNGRSSSPSNSSTQPGEQFPRFTLHDITVAHRRLLTETLGVRHLAAIVGYSMAGDEALDWAATFPAHVDRVVAIAASALAAASDRVPLHAMVRIVELAGRYRIPTDSVAPVLGALVATLTSTPRKNNEHPPEAAAKLRSEAAGWLTDGMSFDDLAAQARAVIAHDVAASVGGDLARAAAATKASVLMIYSTDDLAVSPEASADYARRLGARTVVLPSACGHGFVDPSCEHARVAEAVRQFLAR